MSLDLVPQQPTAARDRSQPLKVTGRLKRALDDIAYNGATDNQAAVSAGMNVLSIRLALHKPHVLAYLRQQRDVLRASMCGRNLLTLAEVRDQQSNQMARVQAVKAIEQMDEAETQQRRGVMSSPGLIIQIVQAASHTANVRSIDANPLMDQGCDRLSSSVGPDAALHTSPAETGTGG